MKITSIDLENIKSYKRQTIELTDGVNAIAGHNGSGKTTILEAIGFALFDYLPYPQSAFVREGEKTGTVRIRLQLNDGREYEVMRRVGAGAMYHVTDVESGVRLADQNKGVQEWLRQTAFDLEGEADLEALFKNAVGVPQGLMTSDFVGTGRTRKAIFDPLLRVEEYEKAWSELLQTSNNIRDRIALVEQEVARLSADVDRIPDLNARHDELAAQVEGSAAVIDAVAAELADIEARKRVLDELHAQLMGLEGQLRDWQRQAQHHGEMVERERVSVAAAERALETVRGSEGGYRKVEEAKRVLAGLEVDRAARDELKERANTATAHMTAIQRAIEEKDRERAAAIADGKAAAELATDVERQTALERDKSEAEMRLREAQRLEADAARMDREITGIERAMESREQQITSARAAQTEAGTLDSVMARQREVLALLAALEPTREQMKSVEAEGKRLRAQSDELSRDVERLQRLRGELSEKEPVAAGRKELEARERELREERVRSQATLDYQEVARSELQRASCPLLELQCPVVHADASVLDRFDRRVADLEDRIGSLEAELTVLTPQLAVAVAASERVQALSVDIAKLESSERALPEITAALDACRKQYGELSEKVSSDAALQKENTVLQREITRLQAVSAEAARLGLLEEQQARDREGLAARRADRARIEDGLKGLAAAGQAVQRLMAELQALGDPRGRQQRLQANAFRLPQIEETLEHHQERLQNESDVLRATVGELHRYDGLDERMAGQRAVEVQFGADHRVYLQNTEEAGQLETRRASLAAEEALLTEALQAEVGTQSELAAVRTRYDPEEHERVARLHTDIAQQLGIARSDHEHWVTNLAEVDKELAFAREQERRMQRAVGERTELETAGTAVKFIRQTIKDAGPAVTETLLQNISAIANDIYAEIMDDHAAELRWDRDYEVVVRRGPDDRTFAQLSGGEQMSAALAVRLALLKEMSGVDMAFFDEPTQNMDTDRRVNLAGQIREIRGFNQLLVISHDDTFEHHTDNLIRLHKEEDETVVEA